MDLVESCEKIWITDSAIMSWLLSHELGWSLFIDGARLWRSKISTNVGDRSVSELLLMC